MRTAHLFAGVGGGMLADLILGHTPVLAVEQEPYCCDVLRERRDDGWFPELTVAESDIREYDFMSWRTRVDCIAAGFPCQDISSAGRGAGLHGAKSGLFFEVIRAIDAIQPRYVFLENSPIIRTRGRDTVIGELVARGYSWRDGKIGAADVGAPHQRDRWFLLAANADGMRELQPQGRIDDVGRWDSDGVAQTAHIDGNAVRPQPGRRERESGQETAESREVAADVIGQGRDAQRSEVLRQLRRQFADQTQLAADAVGIGRGQELSQHEGGPRHEGVSPDGGRSEVAADIDGVSSNGRADSAGRCVDDGRTPVRPEVSNDAEGIRKATIAAIREYTGAEWLSTNAGSSGVVHGLSAKTHRIKALGNAQVPLQAAAAWLALSD